MFNVRERELKEIEYYLSTPGFEYIFIHGQRHMAKTSLIDRVTGKIIRYECILSYTNLDNLSKCVIDYFKEDLTDYVFDSFKSLFQYVFDKSIEESFVLILDNVLSLGCIELIQEFVIKYRDRSKMKLIMTDKKLVKDDSFINHIIHLNELDFETSSLFYPEYSLNDRLKFYSVFGGNPFFNSLIDVNKTADENIIELAVKRDSYLEYEVNIILQYKTRNVSMMNSILSFLASGNRRYSEIEEYFSGYRVDYYLKKLIEMEIIEKSKDGYVISNKPFCFYYRYVFN
ncbi:MAG: ATP-binding protein, partial [Erysipelotrichaceae bacterium]